MLNLKLFSQLQGTNTCSLMLKPSVPGKLSFFVTSTNVNCSVVVAGECDGELPTQAPMSFGVIFTSILPLLNHNYKFRLVFANGVLKFFDEKETFSISPLHVEQVDEFAMGTVQKYVEFRNVLMKYEAVSEKLADATESVRKLELQYDEAVRIEQSGWVNDSSPFGETHVPASVKYYNEKLREANEMVSNLQNTAGDIKVVDLSALYKLADIASRYNTTVAMCDNYAIVSLRTVHVFCKTQCGVRSIQGKLLNRLLKELHGIFYEYKGELIFRTVEGKGEDTSETYVFIQPYLPSVTVDSSLITKGAVQEKYILSLKGMLPVISALASRFTTMTLEMGSSTLVMSNELGEQMVHKFTVENAKTIELNKMLRGENAGPIVMSNIEFPREVQRMLTFFRDEFTIYVKRKKIVLQSGDMYIVFSR